MPLPARTCSRHRAQLFMNLSMSTGALLITAAIAMPATAQDGFNIVYPPAEHKTRADKIFLIGTAPASQVVTINGQPIEYRSQSGHFAPSVPLEVGDNIFNVETNGQSITLKITRTVANVMPPSTLGFLANSFEPSQSISRLPNEPICFKAIATPGPATEATVTFSGSEQSGSEQKVTLTEAVSSVELPPNSAVLTLDNAPQPFKPSAQESGLGTDTLTTAGTGIYSGCTEFSTPQFLGNPRFHIKQGQNTKTQTLEATLNILNPSQLSKAQVISNQGVARTGPSTSYSRLTPLPQGTQAWITGDEGDWVRLDYGGWIKRSEVKTIVPSGNRHSLIRSLKSRTIPGWTEVVFPLEFPVPISVTQGDRDLTLTLHNTIAQTDTIFVPPDAVIDRLDWSQPAATRAEYRFKLKSEQAWGYKLRYDDTSLILSLRHPPQLSRDPQSLTGATILLDAGHGSPNDLGARGPNAYPEKDVALIVTKLLRDELEKRGAKVVMTREGDEDLWPHDRVEVIEASEPDLALSLHYNALPDNGDALNTKGIGTFWYHTQAYDFSVFIHDYLVRELDRESYGVFWNNLALTRPSVTPSILLELGFMINPDEFEWIVDPAAQVRLSKAMAEGITEWFHQKK